MRRIKYSHSPERCPGTTPFSPETAGYLLPKVVRAFFFCSVSGYCGSLPNISLKKHPFCSLRAGKDVRARLLLKFFSTGVRISFPLVICIDGVLTFSCSPRSTLLIGE